MQSSHHFPISEDVTDLRDSWLTQAFSDFVGASARLECSYRELGSKVAELTLTISQKERALLSSRSENDSISNLLHSILQALPCGVLVKNAKGEISLMNSVAARLLALLAAGLPDFSTEDLATGTITEDPAAPRPRATGQNEREFSFATSAGKHFIRVQNTRLRSQADDGGTSVVVIMEDLTDHIHRTVRIAEQTGVQSDSTSTFSALRGNLRYERDPAGLSMEEVERRHLRRTLEQVGGNRTRAAQILRISVRTLSSKIKQYDLPPRRCA